MPEVQSVGAVDNLQYQPSQYPEEAYVEEYGNQPEVYDENMAQMRAANKSRLGATILTTAVVAGLALWGGKAWGKRSAKDAAANYEKAKQAMQDVEKAAEEGNSVFFGKNHCGNNLLEKIKNAFKPFKDNAEEVEKAASDVKDAATELSEKATDAAK